MNYNPKIYIFSSKNIRYHICMVLYTIILYRNEFVFTDIVTLLTSSNVHKLSYEIMLQHSNIITRSWLTI